MSFAVFYNTVVSETKKLKGNFAFSDRNVKIALKCGISCVISIYLAYILELESVLWSATTSLVMMQANLGATFLKGFLRVIGTIAGAVLSFLFYGLFIQNHFAYTFVIALVIIICFYRKERSEYPYFWYLTAMTFIIITLESLEQSSSIEIVNLSVNRAIEITLGIIVTLAVNTYIWPFFATNKAVETMNSLRAESGKLLKEVFLQYSGKEKYDSARVSAIYDKINSLASGFEAQRRNARFEKIIYRNYFIETKNEVYRILEITENCLHSYEGILRYRSAAFQKKFTALFEQAVNISAREIPEIIKQGKNRELKKIKQKSSLIFNSIEQRYRKNVVKGRSSSYPVRDILLFHEFLHNLNEFHNIYFDIYQFRKFSSDISRNHNKTGKRAIDQQPECFFENVKINLAGFKFFLHLPTLRYAIKVSLAVIILLWGWWFLEIPSGKGGIDVAFSALVITQADSISTNQKALQRILGCVIGGVLGLLFLLFQTESTTVYFFSLFAVTALGAYIQSSSQKISYVGLQICLAYYVAIITDHFQVTDIVSISYRFAGIFLAYLCIWFIGTYLWDTDFFTKLKSQTDEFIQKLSLLKVRGLDPLKIDIFKEGVKAVDFSVSRLAVQKELSDREKNLLDSWQVYSRRILYILISLKDTESEFFDEITKVNPDLILSIDAYLASAACVNHGEICDSTNQFDRIISDIEHIKMKFRLERFMWLKDMKYKREFLHTLILLKRLAQRVNELRELHIQIRELVTE